ncbi:hypothetical protein ABDI30_19910 [Paenibacillus cisolokensis]|uniref:hypothetical protein n=1 Tax=Paenibacillus cisolokensis TaxID=1658519 RepID=UPI003D2AFEF5
MRQYHWSVNCAVVYLIFVFIINCGVSIWSTIEFQRLTHNYNNPGQVFSITKGIESFFDSLNRMVDNINPNETQIHEDELNEIQEKSQQLINTAKSTLVYLIISAFASLITTILLFMPEKAMEVIEKFIDIPYTDYDAIAHFKIIMVIANIITLLWNIYGISETLKYFF